MNKCCDMLEVKVPDLLAIVCRLGAGYRSDDLGNPRLTAILGEALAHPRRLARIVRYEEQFETNQELKRDPDWQNKILRDYLVWEAVRGKSMDYTEDTLIVTLLKMTALDVARPEIKDLFVGAKDVAGVWPDYPEITMSDYEKGRKLTEGLLRAILPMYYRSPEQLKRDKEASARQIQEAKELRIFPTHVLFVISHYGAMLDVAEPYAVQDNFNELFQAMKADPEIPVRLVDSYCMVCPPCEAWDRESGLCVLKGEKLNASDYNKLRGLYMRMLRDWRMKLDDPLPAAKFLRKLFDVPAARWEWYWDLGGAKEAEYLRGKEAGVGFLDAYENLEGVMRRVAQLLAEKDIKTLLPASDAQKMASVLAETKTALREHDRKRAYQIITNERFWNCWKGYLEKVSGALARLPHTIRTERVKQADGLPALTARRVSKPVACDGGLDTGEWGKGPFSTGFVTSAERPAIMETAVKALYDRDSLYVGLVCADPDTRALKAEARVGSEILPIRKYYSWRRADDSLAIAIQPDENRREYYLFQFNPKGVKTGKKIKLTENLSAINGIATQACPLCDVDWQAAVGVRQGVWSATVAIPFSLLGGRPRGDDRRWRINFFRITRNDLVPPSGWSSIVRGPWGSGGLDKFDKCGHLLFTSEENKEI